MLKDWVLLLIVTLAKQVTWFSTFYLVSSDTDQKQPRHFVKQDNVCLGTKFWGHLTFPYAAKVCMKIVRICVRAVVLICVLSW